MLFFMSSNLLSLYNDEKKTDMCMYGTDRKGERVCEGERESANENTGAV